MGSMLARWYNYIKIIFIHDGRQNKANQEVIHLSSQLEKNTNINLEVKLTL